MPCPPSEDIPDPRLRPMSLMLPASAGRFFTTSAIWGAGNRGESKVLLAEPLDSAVCPALIDPLFFLPYHSLGRASLVAQLVKNLPTMQETWVRFLSWEDPLEKEMATTLVLLPGESHGQRSLAGCCPWGRKSRTRLSN